MPLPAAFWNRLATWAEQGRTALIQPTGAPLGYADLLDQVGAWQHRLTSANCTPAGQLISIEAEFGSQAVACLLALLEQDALVAPIAPSAFHQCEGYFAQVPMAYRIQAKGDPTLAMTPTPPPAFVHPLTQSLAQEGHPGLVLYSSGSAGAPKAVLHNAHHFVTALLEGTAKTLAHRPDPQTALAFLLWDHIGGQNTLFNALCAGHTLCTVPDRQPSTVLQAIATHRIGTLVTTPSFLNWVLMSDMATTYDVSSLKLVRYGTEVMLASTLARLTHLWPHVTFVQTYGLSETGILPTRSKPNSDGLWMQLGNTTTYPVRVQNSLLEVKTPTTMVGYLNQPTPWTEDGWFPTGDRVEQDGPWFKILGRDSDLINIGGRKVYPAEVEQAIAQLPQVADVVVYGQPHPLLGNMVVANVQLTEAAKATYDRAGFERTLRQHCGQQLADYKVPQKLTLVEQVATSARGKKQRPAADVPD